MRRETCRWLPVEWLVVLGRFARIRPDRHAGRDVDPAGSLLLQSNSSVTRGQMVVNFEAAVVNTSNGYSSFREIRRDPRALVHDRCRSV